MYKFTRMRFAKCGEPVENTENTSQVKSTPAAAVETTERKQRQRVLVKVAHTVLDVAPRSSSQSELAEMVKLAAARAGIAYDSATVTTALNIAWAQRDTRIRQQRRADFARLQRRALRAGDA